MKNIDKIRLYVSSTGEGRSASNDSAWIFDVEFPYEDVNRRYLRLSTNPVLSINGNTGEVVGFTQQSSKDYKPIHYTPHIFELFKGDIKNTYGFDINDLIKNFRDNISTYTNNLKPEEYNSMIDVLNYTGKDAIFGSALKICQKAYLGKLENSFQSAHKTMTKEDKKLSFKEAMDAFFNENEEEIERD